MGRVFRYVFGPVPSRRLGRSLGVNNLPLKICSYSCVYCQAGRTVVLSIERKPYCDPGRVVREVCLALEKLKDGVDYVTFVPNGEPTLDSNLGVAAEGVKRETGVRVAVLTNSSLLFMGSVREDLGVFDLVSLKVDSVFEDTWRRINRPFPGLRLGEVLDGVLEFCRGFGGDVIVETMLVKGVNDRREEFIGLGEFLEKISPRRVYLAVPIRPPAEEWVEPACESVLVEAYSVLREAGLDVEFLVSRERGEFGVVSDPVSSLLSIVSVHPMRLSDVYRLLEKAGDPAAVLERLVHEGRVSIVEYRGEQFVVRRISR